MIKLVRISTPLTPGVHREYCGRPGKGQAGILGNPYWKDESTRVEACEKFRLYLQKEFDRGNSTIHKRIHELAEIARTQDLELACFCVPKQCHTESIKNLIEVLLEKLIDSI
jgi:hypothetical protein